jgi:broad specificity phosphatase PhoE
MVIVVRHAEKAAGGGKDPDLSAAGRARAETLARMIKDAGITAIFTSEFKRTQETAEPAAKLLGLSTTVVPGKDIGTLVGKLRQLTGNALVVGHGDTIPDLMKALGIEIPVAIADDDYTELFVLILGDKPKLFRLHYPS